MTKRILLMRPLVARSPWVAALVLSSAALVYAQEGGRGAGRLPEGAGKELVAQVCAQCHGLSDITDLRNGREGWRDMVDWMIMNGARLTPQQADTVVEYLFESFGPGDDPLKTGKLPPGNALGGTLRDAADISLPAGDGKEVVRARCGLCHDLGRVVAVKRTRSDWEGIIRDMINRGPAATPDQVRAITGYLTSNFGK